MKLLTYKDKDIEYTYYLDANGGVVRHGEFKGYHATGHMWEHSFYCHDREHGESMLWDDTGKLIEHCFFIDGVSHPYVEMSEQEKLLFQIQRPGFRFIED